METGSPSGTVADDGQRQTIGRQGETFDAVEFLIDRCDHLAAQRRCTTESCRRR